MTTPTIDTSQDVRVYSLFSSWREKPLQINPNLYIWYLVKFWMVICQLFKNLKFNFTYIDIYYLQYPFDIMFPYFHHQMFTLNKTEAESCINIAWQILTGNYTLMLNLTFVFISLFHRFKSKGECCLPRIYTCPCILISFFNSLSYSTYLSSLAYLSSMLHLSLRKWVNLSQKSMPFCVWVAMVSYWSCQ